MYVAEFLKCSYLPLHDKQNKDTNKHSDDQNNTKQKHFELKPKIPKASANTNNQTGITSRLIRLFLFRKHVQKNCKVKQIIYDMINFYFELLETFPIIKNNCLQHYVNILIKISIRELQTIYGIIK